MRTSYDPDVTIGSDASPSVALGPNGPWALWHMQRYQVERSSLHASGVIPPGAGGKGAPRARWARLGDSGG